MWYFQVVEAALLSRIQRLEQKLMDLEPRVSMGASEYSFFFPFFFSFFLYFYLFFGTIYFKNKLLD